MFMRFIIVSITLFPFIPVFGIGGENDLAAAQKRQFDEREAARPAYEKSVKDWAKKHYAALIKSGTPEEIARFEKEQAAHLTIAPNNNTAADTPAAASKTTANTQTK